MTFLAPWALWVAGGVAAAAVALHFLASATPRTLLLPTTRFIPDRAATATSRAIRFSDLPLLLVRVAIVMLAGLAFARPVLSGARRQVGRVVMVDRGRLVNPNEALDSATKYVAEHDRLFTFDSTAVELSGTLSTLKFGGERISSADPRGSISVALAAGMRAASALRGDADSVELVLISPLAAEELDAATGAIRAAWPGRVRVVRLTGANGPVARVSIDVRNATVDDPVRVAASFLSRADTANIATRFVRVDRGAPASADTMWAKFGAAVVRWPAALDSSGWHARAHVDSAGAVIVADIATQAVVVSPFRRAIDPPAGRIVARWADGTSAATERKLLNGCVRDVAIPLPRAGDLALRESTRRLVAALAAPCNGIADPTPASDSAVAALRGSGPLVATRTLAARSAPPGALTVWLLAAALLLLLAEPFFRRARATA